MRRLQESSDPILQSGLEIVPTDPRVGAPPLSSAIPQGALTQCSARGRSSGRPYLRKSIAHHGELELRRPSPGEA